MSHYGVTIEAKDAALWTPAVAGLVQSVGFSWARLQEHWSKQNPQQGTYDFAQADKDIQLALQFGLRIDWPLQQAPAWALQPNCDQMPQAQALAEYAVEVFRRYNHAVSAFEVLNEEPSFEQNKAARTPQNYAYIYNIVRAALRGAGYTGPIGMFGFTNYHDTTEITAWYQAFLQLSPNVSYLNLHFYHEGEDPTTSLPGHPSLSEVLAAIRATGTKLPIWLTEFGYRTHCDDQHPEPCNAVSEALQAEYEQKILQILYDDNHRNHAMVYTLTDNQQVMSIFQNGTSLAAAQMFQGWIEAH